MSSSGTFQGLKKLAGDELAEVLLEEAEDDPEVLQGEVFPKGLVEPTVLVAVLEIIFDGV